MLSVNEKEFIYAEKYRPKTIDDMILPNKLLLKIKEWIDKKEICNSVFFGGPGNGKTSLATAIANAVSSSILTVNASKETGIDLIRTKVVSFATSVSFDDKIKIIILSEADGLGADPQRAIRDIIDENSQNCRFILTCNYTDRLIEPVMTRLTPINFDKEFAENKVELGKKILDRLELILQNENVEYQTKDLKQLISLYYPSVREMLINLQNSVIEENGTKTLRIDEKLLESSIKYKDLVLALKNKDFMKARKEITAILSHNGFYQYLYRNIDKVFNEDSIQQAIIAIQHYYDMSSRSRDTELCLSALCAQLIKLNLNFKEIE